MNKRNNEIEFEDKMSEVKVTLGYMWQCHKIKGYITMHWSTLRVEIHLWPWEHRHVNVCGRISLLTSPWHVGKFHLLKTRTSRHPEKVSKWVSSLDYVLSFLNCLIMSVLRVEIVFNWTILSIWHSHAECNLLNLYIYNAFEQRQTRVRKTTICFRKNIFISVYLAGCRYKVNRVKISQLPILDFCLCQQCGCLNQL